MSSDLLRQLSEHLALCGEILELTQRENQALRQQGGGFIRNRGGDGSSPGFCPSPEERGDESSPPLLSQFRESALLRQSASHSRLDLSQARKTILPRLNECASGLRRLSAQWQRLSPAERSGQPEITSLIRQNQELVMRILLLDRENQQFLLQRGLVPARHIPPAQSQKPHFVADLYRRNRVGWAHAD